MNPYGIASVDRETRLKIEGTLEAMVEGEVYSLPVRSSMMLALKNLKLMQARQSARERGGGVVCVCVWRCVCVCARTSGDRITQPPFPRTQSTLQTITSDRPSLPLSLCTRTPPHPSFHFNRRTRATASSRA